MVKASKPDDVIQSLYTALKKEKERTIRLVFKRDGVDAGRIGKAHSRKAQKQLRQTIKEQGKAEDKDWPLFVRLKLNEDDEVIRAKCKVQSRSCSDVVTELMGVFRASFFKRQSLQKKTQQHVPTAPNSKSKSSQRKMLRKIRNKERNTKRKQISKQTKETNKKVLAPKK